MNMVFVCIISFGHIFRVFQVKYSYSSFTFTSLCISENRATVFPKSFSATIKINSVGVDTNSSIFMRARAVTERSEKNVLGILKTSGSKEIPIAARLWLISFGLILKCFNTLFSIFDEQIISISVVPMVMVKKSSRSEEHTSELQSR